MDANQIKSNGFGHAETAASKDDPISLALTSVSEKNPALFSLALAHEIRNPLTNINMAVEMLNTAAVTDEQKAYFDIILRSSARINGLIQNLLSNYQAKDFPFETININLLLDETLLLIKDRIVLKDIQVNKFYTQHDCKILINKDQIIISLINIMINAIDAMAPSKGELKITSRFIMGRCIIEIEDNGIGISKENLKNIFKPYFTNKPGGMGLGLSTSLTTLLSNHARVKVHSKEGKGTQFIIFFDSTSTIDERIK